MVMGSAKDPNCRSWPIAVQALPFLPAQPKVLSTERKFSFEYAGVTWSGRKDLEFREPGGPLVVLDYKTTGHIKYAKTASQLVHDPQALLYALETGESVAELRWLYLSTKIGSAAPVLTRLVITREQEEQNFAPWLALGRAMVRLQSLEKRDELVGDRVRMLRPRSRNCGAYGGCPWEHFCQLTIEERVIGENAMADDLQLSTEALLARLAELGAAPQATTVTQPTPMATVTVAPAYVTPASVPVPATPMQASGPDLGALLAALQGLVQTPPPEPLAAVTAAPVAGDVVKTADVATPEAPAAEDTAQESAAQQAQEEPAKKGRGRPKGSKNKATEDTPVPVPLPPRAVSSDEPAPPESTKSGGYTLLVDCFPIGLEDVMQFEDWLLPFEKQAASELGVGHTRQLDFAKGTAALVAAVAKALNARTPSGYLCVNSGTHEWSALGTLLVQHADAVIYGG
jgi:hypothetical protein